MKTIKQTTRQEFDSSKGQLNSQSTNPPIFEGFEVFKNDENGFFVINPKDQSIFKWIDVQSLECNGRFYPSKELVKGGRRNWEGRMWNSFREGESYYETDDAEYRKCIENFGGFYCAISRATIDDLSEKVNFGNKGTYKVNLITCVQAKKDAAEYANTYAKNNDFISCLPCGAAMDCVFEEIYERFEKEVESIQKNDESKYDAWNRHNRETFENHMQNGLYGIYDLICEGAEFTTEVYHNPHNVAVRCQDSRGLLLIADYYAKEEIPRDSHLSLGSRNFTSSEAAFYNYSYRIILLPKRI